MHPYFKPPPEFDDFDYNRHGVVLHARLRNRHRDGDATIFIDDGGVWATAGPFARHLRSHLLAP